MTQYFCLAGNTIKGSGDGARSGAQTLALLAAPLNVPILRALTDGTKRQAQLLGEVGSPPQTTPRAQLKRLVELGALEKHRRNRFPGVLEYELCRSGEELLSVADALERWLEQSPNGPLYMESTAAKSAIKAFIEAWSSKMLRALASCSLSLTELDGVITTLNYPSLERRLAAMRLAGLAEAQPENGRGTPYQVTEWLRHGIAPLASAARWERRRLPRQTAPVARLDVEAAFLLAVPLLRLPPALSGVCRLAVEISRGGDRRLAGVTVEVDCGTIVACATEFKVAADAWGQGTPLAWLDALIDHESEQVEQGGDCHLTRSLIEGLHRALFGALTVKRN